MCLYVLSFVLWYHYYATCTLIILLIWPGPLYSASELTPGFLMGSVLLILLVLVFYVVLLCVFTLLVACCDVRYNFRIKTMFASSLPSVVCRRVHVLSCFCVFWGILMSNILLLLFFLVFCVVVFALYQVVSVVWTNRIWHKLLYKHTMYVMGIYQWMWREVHYDVTDEKNNVRVEGLNIYYH